MALFGRLDTVELSRQIRKYQVAAHSLGQAPRHASPSQTTGRFACPAGTEKSSDHPTWTFGRQRLASSSWKESQLQALPEPQVSVSGGDPRTAPPGGGITELIMEELNFSRRCSRGGSLLRRAGARHLPGPGFSPVIGAGRRRQCGADINLTDDLRLAKRLSGL